MRGYGVDPARVSRLHDGGQAKRTALELVLDRDGPRCWRCEGWIDVRLSGNDPRGATLGHRIAVAAGGSDELANLAPEHRVCNLNGAPSAVDPRARIARPLARPLVGQIKRERP